MMNPVSETNDNPARLLRKDFFAYRNGIIADKLRNAGDPHTIIMGNLLADLLTITNHARNSIGDDARLATVAQELWTDTHSRECRLAAPMLFPPELMSKQLALQWCENIETTEVADNLCHKLLRHIPENQEVMNELISSEGQMQRYTGYRLMQGLLALGKLHPTASLRTLVEAEADQGHFTSLLKDILEELNEMD